ncbi:fatty acyl-CoA hydrolase precursor, medium chain-like [Neosynchiropus ocellatus]
MDITSKQSLLLLIALPFLCAAAEPEAAPVVSTKLGSLRGEVLTVNGTENKVHAFLGVPFAKPPVGPALRLAAPQAVEAWGGVRNATEQPHMCIQDRDRAVAMTVIEMGHKVEIPEVSEDCLYLNIYTPANRTEDTKLAVMVWIHGGGLTLGAASTFDGSALAAYENVVVVVIQYRLGLLGYLSTGDEHMRGNWGMLDQVQALKWVQEHIHNFGGASDSVTVFGESAGAVCVSLLLLSPLTEGLLKNAIAESGAAAMDALVQDSSLEITQMVANLSGCSVESTEKIADCMRNLDMETIKAIVEVPALSYPVVTDGYFLTKPAKQLLENGELQKVPFIIGVNDDEGGYTMTRNFAPPNWTEGLDLEQVSEILAVFVPDADKRELVMKQYGATSEDRVKNREAITEFIGDVLFNVPAIITANAHRDAGATVYVYEYRYIPSHMRPRRPSFVGSDHGDEISSVFGFCFTHAHLTLPVPCLAEEEKLCRIVMSYWTNFARTGSPNGNGLVSWPIYDKEEAYLGIGVEQVVGYRLNNESFIFLTETLPNSKAPQHLSVQCVLIFLTSSLSLLIHAPQLLSALCERQDEHSDTTNTSNLINAMRPDADFNSVKGHV